MAPKQDNRATPAGGDLSVATFHDEAGRVVHSPDQAATIEIAERTREGDELRRTYMSRGEGARQPYPWPGTTPQDGDISEAVKGTWDVWATHDGMYELAVTKDDLLDALGFADSPLQVQRQVVGRIMTLPSWDNAPGGLKLEVGRWLEDTRPGDGPAQPRG